MGHRTGGQAASLQLLCVPPSGRIFTKVVLEAPLITESALEVIRKYCEDEVGRAADALCPQHRGGAGALRTAACGGDRALRGAPSQDLMEGV